MFCDFKYQRDKAEGQMGIKIQVKIQGELKSILGGGDQAIGRQSWLGRKSDTHNMSIDKLLQISTSNYGFLLYFSLILIWNF